MNTWSFWSYVVQGLIVSLGTSAVLGTWAQIVTQRRHRERLAVETAHHNEVMEALRAPVSPQAGK